MKLKFFKMEGVGNDFIVLDNRELKLGLDKIIEITPHLCDRKFGVGADGLLCLEHPQIDEVDFTMIYRNADGSNAGMCGNGSRCLSLFASDHDFQNSHSFNVHDGVYHAEVNPNTNQVSVSFPDVKLPETVQLLDLELIKLYPGTEHVVLFGDDELLNDEELITSVGSKIRHSKAMNPPGTNVNFVCPFSESELQLQTYERGVEGLTLACGTGAIATAIAFHFYNGEESPNVYEVKVKGGTLGVSFTFDKENEVYTNVKLSGPATYVFEGEIDV